MTSPENTTTRDPLIHLAGMSGSGGGSGYIAEQEAAGQREVVHADVMPAEGPWEGRANGLHAPRPGEPTLESLGFVRGAPVDGDPLFLRCTLPDGWAKRATEHAMWSEVVDERGVPRVSVFYKAAFYDRSAHAGITNVGSGVSTRVIYGDGKVVLPGYWPVLTDEERAVARAAVAAYIEETDIKVYSHREDTLARAKAGLALMDAS